MLYAMWEHRKGSYDEGRWEEVDMYVYLDSEMTLTRMESYADRIAYERNDLFLQSIPYLISQGKDPLGLILLFQLTLAPKPNQEALLYRLGRCLGSLELIFLVSMWQKGTFPCFVPFSPTGDNKSISTGMKLMKTATQTSLGHISSTKCFPLHEVLIRIYWEILVS